VLCPKALPILMNEGREVQPLGTHKQCM